MGHVVFWDLLFYCTFYYQESSIWFTVAIYHSFSLLSNSSLCVPTTIYLFSSLWACGTLTDFYITNKAAMSILELVSLRYIFRNKMAGLLCIWMSNFKLNHFKLCLVVEPISTAPSHVKEILLTSILDNTCYSQT